MIEARAVMVGNADLDKVLDATENDTGDDPILILEFANREDCRQAFLDGECKFSMFEGKGE